MVESSVLVRLHRIHKQLHDLNDRLARGPKLIAVSELRIEQLDDDLATAKTALQNARKKADERQLQLNSRESRIADLQGKLNTAATNKEFQTIKEQIAADEQANSVLSDEVLELLEKIDERQLAAGGVQEAIEKAKDDLAKIEQRVSSEKVTLEAEVERVNAQLHEAEAQLTGDFRTEYIRMARARGDDAMAEVDGTVCTGCYTKITTQMVNELLMSRPLFCQSCGRLLYLPENA
jgi:predicted  nucleic acid-binding Zn-ribbon protein